jgi:hypothetical protein
MTNVSSSVHLLDVDGDGLRDAVAIVGASAATNEPNKAIVYLNSGGTFRMDHPIEIVVPPPPAGDAVGGSKRTDIGPVGAALVTTAGVPASGGGTPTRVVLVITQHRLLRATLRSDKSAFDVDDVTTTLFGPGGLVGATGLAAGDFDGDGVQDIAVADGGSIRIARQDGRLP